MCTATVTATSMATNEQNGSEHTSTYFSSGASTASMDPGSEADEKEKTYFYQNDPSAPMQVCRHAHLQYSLLLTAGAFCHAVPGSLASLTN